jgi:hypothetical protein
MGAIEDTPFPDMFESCESEKCLLQGDIIKISSGECEFFDGQEGALGYVIVSNSCDLERGGDEGLGWISVVPIFPYKVLLEDIAIDKR